MITTGNIEVPGGRIGSGNAQVFDSSGLVRTMDNVLDRQERRRVLALQEEQHELGQRQRQLRRRRKMRWWLSIKC